MENRRQCVRLMLRITSSTSASESIQKFTLIHDVCAKRRRHFFLRQDSRKAICRRRLLRQLLQLPSRNAHNIHLCHIFSGFRLTLILLCAQAATVVTSCSTSDCSIGADHGILTGVLQSGHLELAHAFEMGRLGVRVSFRRE